MRIAPLFSALIALGPSPIVALVTLATVRNLTVVTNECLERVTGLPSAVQSAPGWLGQGQGEQTIFGGILESLDSLSKETDEDRDEIEAVSSTALFFPLTFSFSPIVFSFPFQSALYQICVRTR